MRLNGFIHYMGKMINSIFLLQLYEIIFNFC